MSQIGFLNRKKTFKDFFNKGYAVIGLAPIKDMKGAAYSWGEIDCPEKAKEAFEKNESKCSNFGIITGKLSGLFVLDVDTKNGGRGLLG